MKRETMTTEQFRAMPKQERSKFGIRHDPEGRARRTVDGILFHSQAEAQRWGELKLMQKAGRISELIRQVKLRLCVDQTITMNGVRRRVREIKWVVDFRYIDNSGMELVYEDVKGRGKGRGTETEAFRLKLRLALRKLPPGQIIRIRYADGTVKEYYQ